MNYNFFRDMNMIKPTVTAVFTLMLLMLLSCDNAEENNNAEEERIRPVRVAELEEKTVPRIIHQTANLRPFDEVYIAPANPGRILKIHAEVGQRVREGQLLIEMDPTQLNQAIIQLNNLKRDFQRFDSLIEFGGIPKQQYDQMKTQIEVTKENIEFLKANTNIKAPFSGIITDKFFENGELFSAAPNTQVGKAAILILQRINPIKAQVAVSEKYFPVIEKGMSVDISADVYPGEKFSGSIFRIHPTINPATKTFNIEIRISNSEELLRPGMFSRISLEFKEEPAILVPSNVVMQQIGTNQRFVFIEDNGRAQRAEVIIVSRHDDYLEIAGEFIYIGQKIIVSGHSNLNDGQRVEVVN